MDDYSDYLTSFTVSPYPCGGEDNAPFPCDAASSGPSRSNVYVRFSHHIEDEIESRTICLSDDVLAEESGDDCRSFIVSEGLCYWPIDAETVLDIADEVVEKAVQFKCNLRVEIHSVHEIRGSDDDDVQETYEDDQVDGAAASSEGGFEVKSLKRKRIASDERDRCCVICLEVLTAGIDVVGVMPCNHCSFHDDCLSSWLERSPSCPLCRRKMSAAAAASDSRC